MNNYRRTIKEPVQANIIRAMNTVTGEIFEGPYLTIVARCLQAGLDAGHTITLVGLRDGVPMSWEGR